MTIRTGMQSLVDRVRVYSGAGTAEYTAGTITYWTDDHLQTILDSHVTRLINSPLVWMPQTIGGGTVTYLTARADYTDLEEGPAGTATNSRYVIRDSTGAAVGTANYTPDYRNGEVTFTSNQAGTAYYVTGYSYDVCAAAVEVLRGRLARVNDFYDFSADNQSFSRSQVRKNIREMISDLGGCVGENARGAVSGELHVSQFVRTDLNPCRYTND